MKQPTLVPVTLEITGEQQKAIEHVAKSSGMETDDFIRSCMRKAVEEHKAGK